MLKIAHFADVHWRGLSRHEEYKKSFEDAFEKLRRAKPDCILVAGDIVHSKTQGISPELISCLTWWFRSLGDICETHVTLGNHDGLIMNEDREDAISPVVKAIDHPRVHIHKKSQVVKLKEGYNLCVLSCFDEAGWEKIQPVDEEVNIATFHGAVAGSKTDENWEVKGDVSVDFFKKFDFTMLGDIHKLQYLDKEKRVAYCGSTIQQNYGEEITKGFLLWAIESRDEFISKFVPVKNFSPYVTLDHTSDIDALIEKAKQFPEKSKIRVKVFDDLGAGAYSQIKNALKAAVKPTEIVFKQEFNKILKSDDQINEISIGTFDDVKRLVFDFYPEGALDSKVKETMTSYLKSAWSSAKIDEEVRSGKFQIKRLEFDNTFGYGEGNVINFDSANGITGIFGKNRSGKSSICGTLSYGLFNGSDRGALKNLHIVNTRKSYCNAKIYFSKSGVDYVLERQTTKVVNKKGETTAPTNLNLFLVDSSTGIKRDMSEEQRRETEKTLRDLVGSLDDFLLTSLSSQGNVNKFIDLSAAARKASLSRFLKLEIFDQLNDALKDELNLTKKLLESSNKDFDSIQKDLEKTVREKSDEREKIKSAIESLESDLDSLKITLASDTVEKYTQSEVDDCRKVIQDLEEKIDSYKSDIKNFDEKILELQSKKVQFEKEALEFDKEELSKKKQQLENLDKSVFAAEQKIEKKKIELDRDSLEVKKLTDVPCGDSFPTCKYILSAKEAQKSLENKSADLTKIKDELEILRKAHKSLVKESIEEKLKTIRAASDKLNSTVLEISYLDNNRNKAQSKIDSFDAILKSKRQDLNKMMANICSDDTTKAREELILKKKTLENSITQHRINLNRCSEIIGKCIAELEQIKKEKLEFDIRSHKNKSLKFLCKSLSKNGIPLSIIRKSLPAINKELSTILQHSVGFTVELASDEENNDMEIYIDYGDSKRVIECGSGMEKMMSSIAIRAALINVSNLPKSDLFIVDEGFGALDGKNLEACASLLRELSKNFKSVIVISHVDGIKDVVDHIIEIDNRGRDSYVNFD